MLPLVVSLYGQSPVSVCPITDMNIPRLIRQFLRHAVQVGMEVVDVLFLITVSVYPRAVHSCLHQYTDTGSAVCLRCFPESSAARPTGSGYGCRVGLRGLSDVFRYAGQGRRRRSRNAGCGLFAQCVLRSGGGRRRSGSAGCYRWFLVLIGL